MRNKVSIRFLVPTVVVSALGGCAPELSDYYETSYTSSSSAQRSASAKPKIPLPDTALLKAQPVPDCDSPRTERANKDRRVDTASLAKPTIPEDTGADPNADLALRIKLEYERECYRQAETRVRERLNALQTSTSQTMGAIWRGEQGAR